jgi:hypothetical protein
MHTVHKHARATRHGANEPREQQSVTIPHQSATRYQGSQTRHHQVPERLPGQVVHRDPLQHLAGGLRRKVAQASRSLPEACPPVLRCGQVGSRPGR